MNKNQEYSNYLKNHLDNINFGFEWLHKNLPNIFIHEDCNYETMIQMNIRTHDDSKSSCNEWIPYREYFYGNKEDEDIQNAFNYAWLHHIHNNPHHWQYWLLYEDDTKKPTPLEIPYEYLIEMILDWWSFSWKQGNLYEIQDWYNNHKSMIIMNENSKNLIEEIIKSIIDKLDEYKE